MDENQNYYDEMQEKRRTENGRNEKGSGKGLFIAGLIVGLASALLTVAIYYVAVGMQAYSSNPEEGYASLFLGIQRLFTRSSDKAEQPELDEDAIINTNTVEKLQMLEETIDKYFYLEQVSDEEIRDGIYKGMMEALNDPYTEYYTAEELEQLLSDTEGVFYGIGAYVSLDQDTGLPKISDVIKNSPAEEAKLRRNDLVYEADGQSMRGLSLEEAVKLIRGPEGTTVTLTLIREGEPDYVTVTIERRKVETPTVEFSMLEDGMAYISVAEFDDVTVGQFSEALDMVKEENAKGIILDLRGNPGGTLSSVIQMCRMILPKGMIVYTEDKNGKRAEYKCDGKNELDLPLVVLVDMNSASAAEIMTGAIKDHGIGTIVGTTTYGKGIVQQILPFKDGTAIKITISAYYTPSGKNIHGIGIEPDVICEFDGEAYYGSDDHPDNQLEKAKEVLREKMK
ncbi:MAG: S41 family peptidase [Acetatifactor sp.]